jgi:hypothetical protein
VMHLLHVLLGIVQDAAFGNDVHSNLLSVWQHRRAPSSRASSKIGIIDRVRTIERVSPVERVSRKGQSRKSRKSCFSRSSRFPSKPVPSNPPIRTDPCHPQNPSSRHRHEPSRDTPLPPPHIARALPWHQPDAGWVGGQCLIFGTDPFMMSRILLSVMHVQSSISH